MLDHGPGCVWSQKMLPGFFPRGCLHPQQQLCRVPADVQHLKTAQGGHHTKARQEGVRTGKGRRHMLLLSHCCDLCCSTYTWPPNCQKKDNQPTCAIEEELGSTTILLRELEYGVEGRNHRDHTHQPNPLWSEGDIYSCMITMKETGNPCLMQEYVRLCKLHGRFSTLQRRILLSSYVFIHGVCLPPSHSAK